MYINNKDKALDILFSNASKEKSPVSQAETVKLLQAENRGGFKRFVNQKTILMMTSVFVTFSLLIYFLNPAEKENLNTFNQTEKPVNETVERVSKAENNAAENEIKLEEYKGNFNNLSAEKYILSYKQMPENASVSNNRVEENEKNKKEELEADSIAANKSKSMDLQTVTPTPTQIIELPEEILNKLNITFSRNGICVGVKGVTIYTCYDMKGSMTIFPNKYFKGKPVKQEDGSVRIDGNPEFTAKRDSLERLKPMLITDDGGKNWRAMHFSDKTAKEMVEMYPELENMPTTKEQTEIRTNLQLQFINTRINTLIPVLVKMPKPYRKKRKPRKDEISQDVIMWFEPTDEFLAVLSDTLRKKIVREISENQQTKISALVIENIVIDETKNSFNLSVYPNPVIDKATINFQLEKDKKINIALHDISGKLITIFIRNELKSKGNNSIEIDLKDLIQGVYILSIETADGNILTQRIIKQ